MTDSAQQAMRVLLVQSEPVDVDGLQEALQRFSEGPVQVDRAEELSSGLEKLAQGGVDCVLLDLELPDSNGPMTFERAYAFAPEVPFVIVGESEDDDLAVSTVQAGAQDYLVKGEMSNAVLARSIRYAIERHRLLSALRALSLIDDLTGLYNRRGFAELGEQHLKLSHRMGREVILVYLDLDRFKTINDTLGHHVGDRALMKVADLLRSCFRRSDIIARVGGDEFAVLALEAGEHDEETLVARIRRRFSDVNRRVREGYHLSVSIGVARPPGSGRPRLDELLAEADEAMYREKRSKRRAGR